MATHQNCHKHLGHERVHTKNGHKLLLKMATGKCKNDWRHICWSKQQTNRNGGMSVSTLPLLVDTTFYFGHVHYVGDTRDRAIHLVKSRRPSC